MIVDVFMGLIIGEDKEIPRCLREPQATGDSVFILPPPSFPARGR